MKPGKTKLEKFVGKEPFEQLIAIVATSQSIAMGQKEFFAVQGCNQGLTVYFHTQLFGKVSIGPNIVVAREKMQAGARIGHHGQSAQETCKSFGNYMLVLVPEIVV